MDGERKCFGVARVAEPFPCRGGKGPDQGLFHLVQGRFHFRETGRAMAIKVSVKEVRFYMRNVRTRMPFKYGQATLTSVPILHTLMDVELGDGTLSRGTAADILPPKWFDKDPAKDYERNVGDLIWGARAAAVAYGEAGQSVQERIRNLAPGICRFPGRRRSAELEPPDLCPWQLPDGKGPHRRGGSGTGGDLFRNAQGKYAWGSISP